MSPLVPPLEVTPEELESLLERVRGALGEAGYQKLKAAIRTLSYVTQLLENREATLQSLRRLLCRARNALDLTTPAGRAMAGLLAVFAEFARFCASGCAPVWLTPGRTVNDWVGPSRRPCTPTASTNSAAPDSASRPSPSASTSVAPQCDVF
jgi:hypothetical protein